jgi:hypothetical protein
MEEIYKGHNITASAWQVTVTHEWQPKLMVIWKEADKENMKYPNFSHFFPTSREAEEYALAFAKRWIDDGKPAFLLTST